MAEPVRAGDETVSVNAAETAAVPNSAAPAPEELAWSGDDDVLDDGGDASPQPGTDRQSWSDTWRRAGALLLGGLALAGAIVVGFWVLSPDNRQNSGAASAPSNTPPPTATSAAPPAAPPSIASTPQQDDKYVQSLNDRGISFANPEAAIYNGKMVCTDIQQGMTVPQIVDAFRASNPAHGADAESYVAISVRAYCPQNANLVSGIS